MRYISRPHPSLTCQCVVNAPRLQVIHGRPYHPQGRGKIERFHRTLNLEVLQGRQLEDLQVAQAAFDPWRTCYNHQRPNEALEMAVPDSIYQASVRKFEEVCEPFQYSACFEYVGRTGLVSFPLRIQLIGSATPLPSSSLACHRHQQTAERGG